MKRGLASLRGRQPTGLITVGSLATVTDDTKYNAWPKLCRIAGNRYLVGYTKADSHHQDNTGNPTCRISADRGATWGSEITVYNHATLWASLMGVTMISTGRVIATLWRDNEASPPSGESGIVYSDDQGTTWSAWVALTNSLTQESFGAGPVVELPNRDLLVTIEGTVSGTQLNRSCHTLRSTDGGLTWGSEVTVRDYATDSRPYYESSLLLLDNQTLLCIHRCAANAGLPHYISTSTDLGATWGTPAAAYAGFGSASVIQLSSASLSPGTLVAVTRRDSNSSTIAYTSVDRGVTWSALVVVDATMNEMEYGGLVETDDGKVLLLYGYQPSVATTNADIKSALLAVA